jgi:tetratricopeptide (TPR) repeat protein
MTDQRDGRDDAFAASEDDMSDLLPSLDADAGPARPLSERELALFAARIEQQFARPVPRRLRRGPLRLVLVAASFAASAAAAVYGVVVLQAALLQGETAAPASNAPSQAPRSPTPPSPSPPVPGSDAPEPALSDAAPVEAPTEERPGSERPARLNAAPLGSKTAPRSSPGRSRSPAADRLAAANALRGERRYREALDVYLQVIELDPNGMPAAVARVAAAEMRLEQFGDVAGAEQLYRQAKTRGGELTAEAQFGLAQVYRARAETGRERRALEEFVARHPDSPLVAAARRRLQALGAP